MSRYRIVVAEFATGKVRQIDAPEVRCTTSEPSAMFRFFGSREEAIHFAESVLEKLSDLEVVVSDTQTNSGSRIYSRDGTLTYENFGDGKA